MHICFPCSFLGPILQSSGKILLHWFIFSPYRKGNHSISCSNYSHLQIKIRIIKYLPAALYFEHFWPKKKKIIFFFFCLIQQYWEKHYPVTSVLSWENGPSGTHEAEGVVASGVSWRTSGSISPGRKKPVNLLYTILELHPKISSLDILLNHSI